MFTNDDYAEYLVTLLTDNYTILKKILFVYFLSDYSSLKYIDSLELLPSFIIF